MCPLCCCINSIKYSRKHFSDVSSLSCDRSFKRHYTSSNEVHVNIFFTLFILHFITCSSTAHVWEFNLQIFFFLSKVFLQWWQNTHQVRCYFCNNTYSIWTNSLLGRYINLSTSLSINICIIVVCVCVVSSPQ